MKTTVEVSDTLLAEAKQRAARERTTLRALIERGLRQVLRTSGSSSEFRLRRVTFGGRGMRPEFLAGGWERVRDTSYSGRGG